jgi:hypothetical protein
MARCGNILRQLEIKARARLMLPINQKTHAYPHKPVHGNTWKLQTHALLMEEYCIKESHDMVNKKQLLSPQKA